MTVGLPCVGSNGTPTLHTAKHDQVDEKNIEVKVADGSLTIKGEKQEEKEEKKKDYYLHERSFGSFEHSFELPESVFALVWNALHKARLYSVTKSGVCPSAVAIKRLGTSSRVGRIRT